MTVRVFAVGNELCGDDGVGAAVLAGLRRRADLPGLECHDAGPDALALLDRWDPDGLNVVVDAARMGASPGTWRRFTPAEVRLRPWRSGVSAHGLGLAEALALGERIGALPRQLVIYGVEPATTEAGRGLSPQVAAAVPAVIAAIAAEVNPDAADHPGHR